MKKKLCLLLISTILISFVDAQLSREASDSIRKLSEQDHKLMMALLNITSLRPGANGSNPDAPNAANYDESKANPFPNLPDPLLLKTAKK